LSCDSQTVRQPRFLRLQTPCWQIAHWHGRSFTCPDAVIPLIRSKPMSDVCHCGNKLTETEPLEPNEKNHQDYQNDEEISDRGAYR
jgi:hypothetical protein